MTPPPAHEGALSSLGAALLMVVALLVTGSVAQALVFDTRFLHGLDAAQSSAMAQLLSVGIVVATLLTLRGFGYRSLFHASAQPPTSVTGQTALPVLMLVPGMLVIASGLNALLSWVFPLSEWEAKWFDSVLDGSFVSMVSACVLAPVLEEMLFRGLVLRGFLVRYPPSTAIVHSAAVFGLAHFNIYQFCSAFLIGLVLGELYRRFRSLLPCILLHGAFNAGVLWLAAATGAEAESGAAEWMNHPVTTVIALTVFAGAARWLLRRPAA
jgi:membrane protease YdiL (CAAX protease family)